ncbi:zf-HC2 domain-containing protein [Lachnospiraceae bacterium 62-35]
MTCQEAERMVIPYIEHNLNDEKLEEFLLHIDACPDCREELEIYFTVFYGLKQLDSEIGTYNIKEALKEALEASRERVKKVHVLTVLRYVLNTLSVLGTLVAFLVQLRLWYQNGIF